MYVYDWRAEFPDVPEDVLTENQRDVIYLRYVSSLKFVEIAEEVGRPKEAVVRTHKQALNRIERFLTSLRFMRSFGDSDNNQPPDVL